MAISKERIEELIEKGATIYSKYRSLCLKNFKEKSDCGMYKREVFFHNNILYYIYVGDEDYTNMFKLEDLYETEEEAKFALEFQNIERVERLSLPTWEEFKETKHFEFFDKYYHIVKIDIRTDILIWASANNGIYLFQNPPTKENYLKACSICKKLFLGEVEKEIKDDDV